jgi:FkbM family methyltransferase
MLFDDFDSKKVFVPRLAGAGQGQTRPLQVQSPFSGAMNPTGPQEFGAQNGEDRILIRDFQDKPQGYCVEVGAYNGLEMSNTLAFERLGWKCLLVEADPDLAALCRKNRPAATVIHCAAVAPASPREISFQVAEDVKGMSSLALDETSRRRLMGYSGRLEIRSITVPARTLDAILEEASWPAMDFMSIDVEGHEMGVLKGFDINRWQPKVVLVERCGIFPVWDILRYFTAAGYAFRRRTGDNDWFYRTQEKPAGGWSLFMRFYLLPLPRLLPKIVAERIKRLLFRLGIYQRINRIPGP